MKITFGEKVFYRINEIFLFVLGLSMLLPFIHVLAKSFSGDAYVIAGRVGLWPRDFNINAYKFSIENTPIVKAFMNTLFVTCLGTVLALIVSSATAYPLSLTNTWGRKPIMYFFVFTMIFDGGMIPSFLLMRSLGLLNSLWSIILPHILNVFNMILIKNYFEGLPESVREAAMVDGANNATVFLKIILPMSKPILATMTVFTAVDFWNSYFNAMLYLSDPQKVTLQLFLVNIVKQAGLTDSINSEIIVPPDTVRAATVMISTVPILLVYPFLQKYFVSGITLGSVKG